MSSSGTITPLGTPLPEGWHLEHLGPICAKIGSGATPKGGAAAYSPTGTAFIRSQNVFDHYFSRKGLVFIGNEVASRLHAVTVRPRDVLLNITGDGETIARCCVVPEEVLPARVNQHVMIIRPNRIVLPEFLQRYLSHPAIREYMLSHNSGGSRRALTKRDVENFMIVVPPAVEQRAIADILGALDNKIAVNERIAEGCEVLSRATFQAAVSERAVDRPLSSFADFINGRAFTKDATGSGRIVIRIAELNSGPGGSTVYNDIDVPEQHLARPGDILFAWSGSLTVARWYRPEAIINQHIFKVVPRVGVPHWLAYELVLSKLAEFQRIAADKATTMGHIQRRHLDEPVAAPVDEAIPALDTQMGSHWSRALAAEREILLLAELRDTLLSQLMSGEIRILDAEKAVEDAT